MSLSRSPSLSHFAYTSVLAKQELTLKTIEFGTLHLNETAVSGVDSSPFSSRSALLAERAFAHSLAPSSKLSKA
jgi:hypothetical protein